MSISANVYLILGIDVQPYETDKYDEFMFDDNEYSGSEVEGEIQFIEDGMNTNYNYFGYIVSDIDNFYGNYVKEIYFTISEKKDSVMNELKKLVDMGILKKEVLNEEPKLILFNHCS